MALTVDGTTITNKYTIKYNGTSLTQIICDGVVVWEKIPAEDHFIKIEAYVFFRKDSGTIKITKTQVLLGEALPKDLYFACNAYLNNTWNKKILVSSVTAGETASINEQHQNYSDPPNFTLGEDDRLRIDYTFYTYVDGEKENAELYVDGKNTYTLTAGTITADTNYSFVYDTAQATVWCAT